MKENGVQSSTESSTISYSNVVIPEGMLSMNVSLIDSCFRGL